MSIPRRERLIYVDLNDLRIEIRDFPKAWRLLGGRALGSRILLTECAPTCDPLGPDNLLVLAPGVLGGSAAPSSGRLSVVCKSPITGAIQEANVGGNPGQHLSRLGYRALVIKGRPSDPNRRYGLEIDELGVRLQGADDYKGMWNYETCHRLLADSSRTASAISIGPAGEQMLAGASVACTDSSPGRRPARQASRGGPGAVMGAKCLKWIRLDPGRLRAVSGVDRPGFSATCKSVANDSLLRHAALARTRGGETPEACMSGCVVRCSKNGSSESAQNGLPEPECATVEIFGKACAINQPHAVRELDRLCDELGLDTIETGAAIALLMNCGGIRRGDAAAAERLLRKVARGDTATLAAVASASRAGRMRKRDRLHGCRTKSATRFDGTDNLDANAAADASGICRLLAPDMEMLSVLYSHFEGEHIGPEQILEIGRQCLRDEDTFNRLAGVHTDAADTSPHRFGVDIETMTVATTIY